jgi:hypothetical protein
VVSLVKGLQCVKKVRCGAGSVCTAYICEHVGMNIMKAFIIIGGEVRFGRDSASLSRLRVQKRWGCAISRFGVLNRVKYTESPQLNCGSLHYGHPTNKVCEV